MVNASPTSSTGRPLPPPTPWRLLRAEDGKLAGVCTGLSRASGVDLTLVRLAVVAACLSGFGVIAYIVLAVVVPKEPPAAPARPIVPLRRRPPSGSASGC